jgi:hypothetical protein
VVHQTDLRQVAEIVRERHPKPEQDG